MWWIYAYGCYHLDETEAGFGCVAVNPYVPFAKLKPVKPVSMQFHFEIKWPSDLGSSDPGPSDPGPSDPGPSDPGPSHPGLSDPGPSDPGPWVIRQQVIQDPVIQDPEWSGTLWSGTQWSGPFGLQVKPKPVYVWIWKRILSNRIRPQIMFSSIKVRSQSCTMSLKL